MLFVALGLLVFATALVALFRQWRVAAVLLVIYCLALGLIVATAAGVLVGLVTLAGGLGALAALVTAAAGGTDEIPTPPAAEPESSAALADTGRPVENLTASAWAATLPGSYQRRRKRRRTLQVRTLFAQLNETGELALVALALVAAYLLALWRPMAPSPAISLAWYWLIAVGAVVLWRARSIVRVGVGVLFVFGGLMVLVAAVQPSDSLPVAAGGALVETLGALTLARLAIATGECEPRGLSLALGVIFLGRADSPADAGEDTDHESGGEQQPRPHLEPRSDLPASADTGSAAEEPE